MGLIRRNPEHVAAKEARQREELVLQRRAEFEYTWRGFWESPPGVARRAFKNGDHVFQYSLDVLDQTAIMTAMVGSSARIVRLDPSAVLDAVCREGWDLVNGSFVFMRAEDRISSRETVKGYYLLKRCEENREPETEEELAERLGWSQASLDQPNGGDPTPGEANDAETAPTRAGNTLSCPECGATFPNPETYFAHYQSRHQNASVA